jgi:hypothetical protein
VLVAPPLPVTPPVPPTQLPSVPLQAQSPLMQVVPPEQAVQLEPQWAESVLELHALSLHIVLPEGHDDEHCPALQTFPLGHTVQALPQWSVFEETHALLQATSPGEQAQMPA